MRKYRTTEQRNTLRLLLRLLLVLLMGAGIFFMCEMTLKTSKHTDSDRIYVYIFGAMLLSYFVYKIRLIHILTDREWDGEIISLELRNGWYCPDLLPTKSRMKETVYIDLKVRRSNGKTVRISYNTVHIPASYYSIGMKVRHYRGATYLVYSTPPRDKMICPICAATLESCDCARCRISF